SSSPTSASTGSTAACIILWCTRPCTSLITNGLFRRHSHLMLSTHSTDSHSRRLTTFSRSSSPSRSLHTLLSSCSSTSGPSSSTMENTTRTTQSLMVPLVTPCTIYSEFP